MNALSLLWLHKLYCQRLCFNNAHILWMLKMLNNMIGSWLVENVVVLCLVTFTGFLGQKCILLHFCTSFNDKLTPHFIQIMIYQMNKDLCGNQLSTTVDPTWRKAIHQTVAIVYPPQFNPHSVKLFI